MASEKLYTVRIEAHVVVLAKDFAEAYRIAEREARNVDEYDTHAQEMIRLPSGVELDDEPFVLHGYPDDTIRELVEKGAAPLYTADQAKIAARRAERDAAETAKVPT